jgi:hypothetical protein
MDELLDDIKSISSEFEQVKGEILLHEESLRKLADKIDEDIEKELNS